MFDWITNLQGAVTVSDANNNIIYMNKLALQTWEHKGGASLLGGNLLDCHNDHSKSIIDRLLKDGGTNTYTIEKAGIKKLIFQSAWTDDNGKIGGLVEISIVLPDPLPHFVRK